MLAVDPLTSRWCAESRRDLLVSRAVAGDLPLADVRDSEWTLERLHLCEEPPRFPRIFFRFASDALDSGGHKKVMQVARLLCKHPKLRIRINGYAQPEAPHIIGEALSQARATSVRRQLLLALAQRREWCAEDPELGVRIDSDSTEPWANGATRETQLVGDKIQALGRWRQTPINRNFMADTDADRAGDDAEDAGLRCAEFTLLGLASEA